MLVSFLITKYQDKVLCDVVSMYASHILLGSDECKTHLLLSSFFMYI